MGTSQEELIAKYGRSGPGQEKTAEKAKALGESVEKATGGQAASRGVLAQAKDAGHALHAQGVGKEATVATEKLGQLPVQGTPANSERSIAATPAKSLMADYRGQSEPAAGREDVVAKYGRSAEASKEKEAEKAKEPDKEPGA